MKNIFKFFGTILTVVLAAFSLTGCMAEEDLGTADLGLHVKVFFPTKVVAGQPMTINGSGFADATAIVFPGVEAEVVVTDFQIVSNDMIRVNAPKGIAAEGGKIIVRTAEEQVESPLPLTLGETKISGYSADPTLPVEGGTQMKISGTDLEFITGVELRDADGNPALIEDKFFNRKGSDHIIFTVPRKVFEGRFVGKVYTIDGKTFEMPELEYKPASDGGYFETQKIMIWENDGTYGEISWSSDYRFALEGTNGNGDAIVAEIPADTWAIMKDGTFYMTISGGDAYQIRVNTGWWSFDGDGVYDIHKGDERLVDNGDGTFTLAVTMSEEPLKSGIYDLVDVQHLLFTGSGYTIHNLYYTEDVWVPGGAVEIVRTSIWKNDGSLGEGSWGNTYRFALEGKNGGDASVDVPADLWALMKNGPFYLQVQPVADWWQIRVLTGWWGAQWPTADDSGEGDINVNWTDIVADNGDGTFTVTLDFTGHAILDAMDDQNLLFAGAGFQILEIYVQEEVFIPGAGGDEPAEVVVWENDGSFPVCSWSSHFRFGLEGKDSLGECAATFPADVWERLKSAPFNILIEAGDWFSIRVMDGWWSVGNDQSGARDLTPETEGVVNNGDGTWVVPIALPDDLLPVLDDQHLLFSGGDYTIQKIYYYE